ncbi:TetR/AcrR family transcriptional regulator [Acidaminobacter sp. JC074]|uniref:TetR/AcrR family transcriptional regulator n=1 Tax=Acidaminobacter sp. JC074 TaxID=2530199 RepID=UPI001F0EB267|nr:TetR/AcrR family transcriptional regulator [Acidaminobacter sp. JC074]MCH4886419.1 TetR/AcrR family transcriptional regulator [Acidaminobacter sp. JC074]
MLKNQAHPAGIRSKELITENLMDLMKEMPYQKITIKSITEKAVLTRRTFYAHFQTKEDVLNYELDKLNQSLLKEIIDLNTSNQRLTALTYFQFWTGHTDLLQLMKDQNLLPILFENFDKSIRAFRSMFGCDLSESNQQYRDYSSAYFTGVLSNIITCWLENGMKESAEELVDILALITNKLSSNFDLNLRHS